MEINQIESMLNEIEQNARAKIVEINGVLILKDDEPKYRALLALKDFLSKNENVIRELNVLAKAAGVATNEIMATFIPSQAPNIEVGLGDPTITVPKQPGTTELDPELKKKSDLESGALVTEPKAEEIIVDAPVKVAETPGTTEEPKVTETPGTTEEPKVTETPGVTEEPKVTETPGVTEEPKVTEDPKKKDEVLPEKSMVMPQGDVESTLEPGWPVPPQEPAAPIVTENSEEKKGFNYQPMSDEEVAAAMKNIQTSLGQGGPAPAAEEPKEEKSKTEEPKAPSAPVDTPIEAPAIPGRKKVVSRRQHTWKDRITNSLVIIGAIVFGENVSNRSQSYKEINVKIGYVNAEICKKNPIDESQIEKIHSDIVSSPDLTTEEKRRLYKKLGRLDKAIERANRKNNGESRGRK